MRRSSWPEDFSDEPTAQPHDRLSGTHTVYGVGETFFEMGPEASMLVKNEDPDTDAVVVATFIVPVGAAPLTIPTEHLCGIEG